jgi:hypothetical protein
MIRINGPRRRGVGFINRCKHRITACHSHGLVSKSANCDRLIVAHEPKWCPASMSDMSGKNTQCLGALDTTRQLSQGWR